MTFRDMQPQSNPNSAETSRVQPHFLKQNELRYNWVGAAKPTPFFLAPLETRRATINLDKAVEYELKHGRQLDHTMDRKKLRRTVSNRLSAHRSRLRKAHYIDDMEKKVDQLEETITAQTERVKRLKEQSKLVREQNEELERLLEFRINEAIHSQKMIEKNRAELNRLKAEQKDLLKHQEVEGNRSSGPRSSGLYEDVKVQIKRGDAAMNPFHNVDG